MNAVKANRGSKIARLSAARLAAVQGVYQMKSTGQSADSLISEYKNYRLGQPVEGADMVLPDGILFEKIIKGVKRKYDDLRSIIDTVLLDQSKAKARDSSNSVEPLLDSILLCGAFELLACPETDAPVIIADYLEVTHAFYEGGESRLVNGILDNINKIVRDV